MTISIIGCGWLGFPLAERLIKRNYTIKGSTTSENKIKKLRASSIKPFLINLNPGIANPEKVRDFWQADILIINIPPGRRRKNVIQRHTEQIQAIIDEVTESSIKHVIFISSTSVYPKNPGKVKEDDTIPGKAGRNSGNALLKAEQLLKTSDNFETTVIRFGGLIGGNRHPAKYLAGKKNMTKANAPVNLIHREDCIEIITQIIERRITGEIFNAVSDDHPTRKAYYCQAANVLGLEPPTFRADEPTSYKIVSSEKLKTELGYSFIYPSLMMPL